MKQNQGGGNSSSATGWATPGPGCPSPPPRSWRHPAVLVRVQPLCVRAPNSWPCWQGCVGSADTHVLPPGSYVLWGAQARDDRRQPCPGVTCRPKCVLGFELLLNLCLLPSTSHRGPQCPPLSSPSWGRQPLPAVPGHCVLGVVCWERDFCPWEMGPLCEPGCSCCVRCGWAGTLRSVGGAGGIPRGYPASASAAGIRLWAWSGHEAHGGWGMACELRAPGCPDPFLPRWPHLRVPPLLWGVP